MNQQDKEYLLKELSKNDILLDISNNVINTPTFDNLSLSEKDSDKFIDILSDDSKLENFISNFLSIPNKKGNVDISKVVSNMINGTTKGVKTKYLRKRKKK